MFSKRKQALLLALIILIQVFPVFDIVSAGTYSTATTYYDGTHSKKTYTDAEWTQLKLDYMIPASTAKQSKGKFPFNIELWIEKRIIVYGDYSSVPSAKNDFKNATGDLDAEGKYIEIKNKGYYEGGTGEYRYHGFDVNDGLYANGDFPVDANSGLKATAKNWIYRIWDVTTPYHNDPRNTIKEASEYNKIATGEKDMPSGVKTAIQTWIKDGLPFEIVNSNNTDKSAFNYAQVLTPPTTLASGEVQMYHLSKFDGKPWYQVFSLETIKHMEITPVQATVEIINEWDAKNVATGKADKYYEVRVNGKLLDDAFYNDPVLKTAKYTRDDIASWSMTLVDSYTGIKQTLIGTRSASDKGIIVFTVKLNSNMIDAITTDENRTIRPIFNATATAIFTTGDKSTGTASTGVTSTAPRVKERKPFEIKITAPNEMLDTEKFKISDTTTGEDYSRTVSLEGVTLSEADADLFLSGNYLFPLIGNDKVYTYSVEYVDAVSKQTFEYLNYIVVYTTKPRAQMSVSGTFKENRLISASSTINSVNSSYLKANATISANLFDATATSGNNNLIKFGTKNTSGMDFIVKGSEQIYLQIQASASVNPSKIERSDIPAAYHTSDVYTYSLYTLEDYAPAMTCNIWNGTLTRSETLDFTYDASSVDLDNISVSTYKIYYDSDGDGAFELLIKQGNYADYTPYQPSALGHYKIVFYAEESFGQPTLPAYITEADKKTATVEREFYVDNLAPMAKLYTDIEYEFPQADLIVLNDQSITRELNNTIVSERVNWINGLRQSGLDASVQVWDLFTYVYSQSASTTINSGGSYPSATTSYSSGGYSGTLSRYNVVNNQYQVDNGYYKTVTESMTASDTVSQSGTVLKPATTDSDNTPSSIGYSSGGFSGTLYKTGSWLGYSASSLFDSKGVHIGYTYSMYAAYSGTVSKQTQVWQSNWQWVDDYTGYYLGTIYKNFKQSFTPTFRASSDKYLVYFAESNINNQTDIQAIKSKGTVKVILVGKPATKSQLAHDYYIDSTKPLGDVMTEINELIASVNPVNNTQLVQVGETFNLQKADYDLEGDPITDLGYQYVHNANYYDNSTGLEPGAVTTYSEENSTFSQALKTSIGKPGKYSIYRKIKDVPVANSSYTKESNIPKLDIYVHRKPIADFTLDWDYSTVTATYQTTWVDKSYDLDHQYTDPQKGIVDRKIMYRKTSGDNVWIYAIPDNLSSGTYELRYIVKDIEGAWSDEKVFNFTLSNAPAIQLQAELRALNPSFSLTAIPASESVEFYNVWSRYPYGVRLETALYNLSGTRIGNLKNISFIPGVTGVKVANDITWNDIPYQIAETTPDGNYHMRITAFDSGNSLLFSHINFPVTVMTPIHIQGEIDALTSGELSTITARTSPYAASAQVTLFQGTPFQQIRALTPAGIDSVTNEKLWQTTYNIPTTIPEGPYNHLFSTQTPAGKSATDLLIRSLDVLNITSLNVRGFWNHWRGQTDLFGKSLLNQPHRFLGYEKIEVTCEVVGNPDLVELRLSSELEAMSYRNSLGQLYRYADEFGFEVAFPLKLDKISQTTYQITYILPLSKETLSWENQRLNPPYTITVTAKKGAAIKTFTVNDIEITGTIHDLLFVQPEY